MDPAVVYTLGSRVARSPNQPGEDSEVEVTQFRLWIQPGGDAMSPPPHGPTTDTAGWGP
jgi:hypothetical protein